MEILTPPQRSLKASHQTPTAVKPASCDPVAHNDQSSNGLLLRCDSIYDSVITALFICLISVSPAEPTRPSFFLFISSDALFFLHSSKHLGRIWIHHSSHTTSCLALRRFSGLFSDRLLSHFLSHAPDCQIRNPACEWANAKNWQKHYRGLLVLASGADWGRLLSCRRTRKPLFAVDVPFNGWEWLIMGGRDYTPIAQIPSRILFKVCAAW